MYCVIHSIIRLYYAIYFILFPHFLVLKILWNNCQHIITWLCLSRSVVVSLAFSILEVGILPEKVWIAKMLSNKKKNIHL